MKFKFAVVEGERREAKPRLSGKCQYCGDAMIAKCGQIRVWHWAHRGTRTCDPWWESETDWHRAWKNRFPKDWQEIIHQSADGEKHIADVKTESGVVVEFQHSFLRRDEREAREKFYQKMVWVVDGLGRKRDRWKFFALVDKKANIVSREPLILSVWRNEESALLRDWGDSRKPVFFDFGDDPVFFDDWDNNELPVSFRMPVLWRLDPHSRHLSPVLKTSFLDTGL